MNTNVRFRVICAFIIDIMICGLPCYIYMKVYSEYFIRPSLQNLGIILGMMLLAFLWVFLIVFRDLILRGRSIGKRIFGLYVLDKGTMEPASVGKRIVRNLFFFAYIVDFFILLITKESIGDKITRTVVVKK